MSNNHRRATTVFDLASLRLRKDGSRVLQQSLRPRDTRDAVRDVRGNWMAVDAGGPWRVKKRRAARPSPKQTAKDDSDVEAESRPGDKGKQREVILGKEKDPEIRQARRKKRRKVDHDLGFHDTQPHIPLPFSCTTAGAQEQSSLDGSHLPLPSSDLLKCIHHFASCYYSERGQLLNASKEYRLEKKQRRLQRLQRQNELDVSVPPSALQDEDLTEDEDPQSDREQSSTASTSKQSSPDRSEKQPKRDMYKTMDGSALMAIGMLLQEHVAHLLMPQIPDDCEEHMLEMAQKDGEEDEGNHPYLTDT